MVVACVTPVGYAPAGAPDPGRAWRTGHGATAADSAPAGQCGGCPAGPRAPERTPSFRPSRSGGLVRRPRGAACLALLRTVTERHVHVLLVAYGQALDIPRELHVVLSGRLLRVRARATLGPPTRSPRTYPRPLDHSFLQRRPPNLGTLLLLHERDLGLWIAGEPPLEQLLQAVAGVFDRVPGRHLGAREVCPTRLSLELDDRLRVAALIAR